MDNFITWVSAPEAYNWITLMGALAAAFAAVFTGYTAYVAYQGRRQTVQSEWHSEFREGTLLISCIVKNKTDTTIIGDRFIVEGPVSNVLQRRSGRTEDKHEGWPLREVHAQITVKPRTEETAGALVLFDHEALRSSAKSLRSSLRLKVTKVLWKLMRWQFPAGPKVSITLIVRRKSSPMRPIRLTHNIRIYPERAINIADTISDKEASR